MRQISSVIILRNENPTILVIVYNNDKVEILNQPA